jgi:hypothetical protein
MAQALNLLTAAMGSCRQLLADNDGGRKDTEHLLSVLYCNRAAVHVEQGSWIQAKVDAKLAIQQVCEASTAGKPIWNILTEQLVISGRGGMTFRGK